MSEKLTSKQRMLNAYRGLPNDRTAVAPEFWYYYPAKVLGVDMIEFGRTPFHLALKTTFEKFECEGWGASWVWVPNNRIASESRETWLDADTLEVHTTTKTPRGNLTTASRSSRQEPNWTLERSIKDVARDLPAWEEVVFGGNVEDLQTEPLVRAWREVGESYLLEAWVGVPFFDFYAGDREGGFETGIYDFMTPELIPVLERLQRQHLEMMVDKTRLICERTPVESLCIGCSWSCNSLLGPDLWRRWDKPGIQAVVNEAHRHGRLVHVHFHGRCMDTVADFAEIGVDCVCPFERAPGGDIVGLEGLQRVERLLHGRTTMNGNLHTVETLIRGKPEDVRREVREIKQAFRGNPRVIIGTGDQVGRETPEENLIAMIEEAKRV